MTLLEAIQSGYSRIEQLIKSREELTGSLTKAQNDLAASEASLKKANEDLALAKSEISTLQTAAAGHASALEAKDKEIAGLKSTVEAKDKEAKSAGDKAIAITAAQGISAAQLPAGQAVAPEELHGELQKQIAAEKDPAKRAILCRKAREARGHGGLFVAPTLGVFVPAPAK